MNASPINFPSTILAYGPLIGREPIAARGKESE